MRFSMMAALILIGALAASPARAGIFADDLTRCVVTKAAPADQQVLIRWIFAAMAEDPALMGLSTVSDNQRAGFDKNFAALTDRLLLVDCRGQLMLAIKNEGPSVIETAFRVLGETAMRGVMGSPQAQAAVSAFAGQLDKTKWETFRKEAGLPEPGNGTPKP